MLATRIKRGINDASQFRDEKRLHQAEVRLLHARGILDENTWVGRQIHNRSAGRALYFLGCLDAIHGTLQAHIHQNNIGEQI